MDEITKRHMNRLSDIVILVCAIFLMSMIFLKERKRMPL